ncbi:uncharacterized protein Triagg1_6985 [Trichoderma aggressivum f. europaeum]|uniref:Ubiquitin-like domain-containing protein n=1 Tax=Trichoderma aggressivum f. europaeum TaxID=173218 RepID=A0AAE1M3B8_9HYPO|nr:hypothetical protein Triagg1_6985 [Trichoderma aggressivum f. europaeum]
MSLPFSLSVSDFFTVGQLIGKVAVELRGNGEAAPEYQSLLIELEALERALRHLQTLKPAKHELLQLTSIRATALACERPLRNFLDKVSKFERRLGSFDIANNTLKGLPRKMQFNIMLKEDIKELRSALASHVATINLLLMTQAVTSISVAENDRSHLALSLESKILAHSRVLQAINGRVDTSLVQQREIKMELETQSSAVAELGGKVDEARQSIQKIETMANHTRVETKSTLEMVTETLSLLTSGVMHLHQITKQLRKMIRICATFTEEMRTALSKLMDLFISLQKTLQRIDHNIPMRVYLPTVQFTTALGETMSLPYQLCQQWTSFKELLRVIFLDKPGKFRVDMGKYLIMNARGGRILAEASWQHAVRQDDHLSMSIVLDELSARSGRCPFPSCHASTESVEAENGGRTCPKCGRWSLLTLTNASSSHIRLGRTTLTGKEYNYSISNSKFSSDTSNGLKEETQLIEDKEDIELYRQIQVQVQQSSTFQPSLKKRGHSSLLKWIKRRMKRGAKANKEVTVLW